VENPVENHLNTARKGAFAVDKSSPQALRVARDSVGSGRRPVPTSFPQGSSPTLLPWELPIRVFPQDAFACADGHAIDQLPPPRRSRPGHPSTAKTPPSSSCSRSTRPVKNLSGILSECLRIGALIQDAPLRYSMFSDSWEMGNEL